MDEKRGLVFVPTGSAAFDFYGSNRLGDDLFANTLLALKADTGERVWHFQDVHHDLWDRDFPAPPNLVTVKRDGKLIDAVAQITKSGYVYVFDRETGKPLVPDRGSRVSRASEVDGEVTAATQPFPVKPPPFARQILTEDMLTTPHARSACRASPTSSAKCAAPASSCRRACEGTVIFPGFDGGGEWGGRRSIPRPACFT